MATFEPSGNYVLHSMKPCDLSSCTKRQIKEYFENSYDLYETLFLGLKDESAFYKCPDRLRLPLIFYFGHTAAVYANKLVLGGLLKERINFHFETLFETGVDEMSWDDTENYRMGGNFVWPRVSEVAEYRKKVRQVMLDIIDKTPLKLPVTQESEWWAVFMGMEHERIHFETSSVLIRQMPLELVKKLPGWKNGQVTSGVPVLSNPLIQMPEQAVSMGKPENFPSYGWDNEYGEWNVKVPPFKASKYLVTNREYLEFVNDGGYENSKYWTKEGWQWKQFRKLHHPSFWVCGKGCKSGCGADLASYSHCNLATDVNHNGLSEIDASDDDNMKSSAVNGSQSGDLNGVGNGFHQNGLSNGAMNGHQNGESNGVMNGHQNGESNGVMNGHQKGESNGVMNGHQNGDSNGIANGHHNGVSDSAVTDANTCSYKYRAMFELLDMPMSWPVEVNYHEVKAYCAWKGPGYRLPTEAEHHVMRGPQKPPSAGTASDIIFQDKIAANINMAYGSSTPVNMYPPTEAGFCDVFGNVWEWVEDHFNGFSDFKPHLLYDDFSTPTFDGRHNMILGGSWVSTGDEASRFARYAFRRHFFQHLGFRVAQSLTASPPVRLVGTPVFVLGVGVEDNPVTLPGVDISTAYVSSTNKQYHDDAEEFLYSEVLSHYGDVLGVESTAEECKQLALVCREAVQEYNCPEKKILDVMCSLGRFSYELSNLSFQEVIAIDHSGRLLDAALKLQQGKPLDIKSAGDLPVFDIPLWKIFANLDGVSFQQFTWLPNEIGLYDLIVMRSLDRLASPKAWLVRLWEIINPVGLVIIKPSNNWDISSLRAVLENKFTLMETRVLPNRREGLRKSDMCHSSVTIWRLKH